MISVKEKIEKLIDLLNKELKYKSSNISEHKLTLTFLVNLILNNDGKTIIINENHATIIE